MRSFDADRLLETMEPFLPLEGFHPYDWLADERNIALSDGDGSFALFEFNRPGVYTGHYFFLVKGKEAIKLSQECLDWMFDEVAEIILGLTPVENKPARWMSRKMGFLDCGEIGTREGACILYMKTKEDHNG